MIVPMKKAVIIAQAGDAGTVLHDVRSLGVLHVEHQTPPSGKDINSIKDDIATLDKVINALSSPEFVGKGSLQDVRHLKDWRFTAKHILDTLARIDHLGEFSRGLAARISEWEKWGDFNPVALLSLKDKGINIKLCEIPVKEIESLPKGIIVKKIKVLKATAYCALISREEIGVRYKDSGLPKMSLSEMKARLTENGDTVTALNETMRKHTCYLARYREIKKAFDKELEFHEALRGMGDAGQIVYIVGYVPRYKEAALMERAAAGKWGISIKEPTAEDDVPTLVRTPRWASIIEPMFKLIEIVPGYSEMDISPVFLLFLSLFFGMIIGDAGYGLIYICLTFFMQKTIGKRMKDHRIFHLLYLFSGSAVLWGVITGTIFGQEWYLKAGFKAVIPILNDTKFLQAFCFFIGAVHLTIAQAWQGIRKLPALTALADAGWICVLWAAFFLARMLILSDPLPGFTNGLLIIGVLLVIFCTSPQRNVFKMIAEGLGTVVLNIMNSFTDVVSYIRLFAVGLAGVAISDTVNSLASSVSGGNFLIHSLIVFLGHTINIVLGPMSVLVHGVRLNVLEFSAHAGLTWSGRKYKPLENMKK